VPSLSRVYTSTFNYELEMMEEYFDKLPLSQGQLANLVPNLSRKDVGFGLKRFADSGFSPVVSDPG
jgi:hypothetical protein